MRFLTFLFEQIMNLLDPANYEAFNRMRTAFQRLCSKIKTLGPKARIAIGIALFILIAAYGWYLVNKNMPAPVPAANENTWTSPNGRTIALGKITGPYNIEGGELVVDNDTVHFITHNNSKLQGCHTLTVPKGHSCKLVLPDGTSVMLNADSKIQISAVYGCGERELFLEGEGFFDIFPRAGQPLTVHSCKTAILALGTSFNVNTYTDKLQVALATGSVLVDPNGKKMQLQPGQMAIKDKNTGQITITTFFDTRALGWMEGRYDITGKPMEEVKGVLERWYNVTVVFDNPDLAKQMFGGAIFRNEPLITFLKVCKEQGYFNYETGDDGNLHLK